MKNIITLIALAYSVIAFAQSNTENYVTSKTYKKPSTGTITQNDISVNVQYYDGLGRVVQTIAARAGANGQDIITPIAYDWLQRQTKQYLPYADHNQATSSLDYRDPVALLMSLNTTYQQKYLEDISSVNPNPYSETFYELSPLNRVIEQSAPGQAWLGTSNGDDHTIKFSYNTNTIKEVRKFGVKFPIVNTVENTEITELVYIGFYNSGDLYKTITKDENWIPTDGLDNTTEEFKDKLGRIILKRMYNEQQKHDTYYVYDDFGNLTYVIPPAASDNILNSTLEVVPISSNYPWIRLAEVDNKLAEEYGKKLEEYDNENILNIDLLSEYGGMGGFTLLTDENGDFSLNINVTTATPMPYRNGVIASLHDLGEFTDQEVGRLSGDGYEYIFIIRDNKLELSGYGNVPSIITSFTGKTKLSYTKNYSWAEMADADPDELKKYLDELNALDNSQILSANIQNVYGASGGLAVSFAEDDTFSLSLNVSATKRISFKDGTAFTLDVKRPIPDGVIGEVSGQGYHYSFQIDNNTLKVYGSGEFTNIVFWGNKRPVLRYFLNPEAERLCYIYHYDKHNRVVEKHIPDNGWTHFIYDKLDRQVLAQDENLRLKNDWLFTKYDDLSRVIMTGKYTDVSGRERSILQYDLDNATGYLLHESKSATPITGLPGGIYLYYTTNLAFPVGGTIYTIQYYDDYFYIKDNPVYARLPDIVFGQEIGSAKGLPTMSHIKVLEGSNANWVTNTVAYDVKGQTIWNKNINSYLNITNLSETNLDFTGKPVETKTIHTKASVDLTVHDFFEYDNAERLLRQSRSINNGALQTIVFNHYDELGNLDQKKIGASASGSYTAASALQTLDYDYNIRGWLTGINNPQNINNDLFAFGIDYTGLYNGNIASTSWISGNEMQPKQYHYNYDGLNRLTDATYMNPGNPLEKYHEKGIAYDKNGNIKGLQRWGYVDQGVFDKTDDLVYTYKPMSNQLLKVQDNGLSQGFKDGTNTDNDYDYDVAGNMSYDLNKNLGNPVDKITYNHLNLPKSIIKDSTHKVEYIYDASGTKIEKKVTDGTTVTTTHYSNGFVYENNVLQYFSHPEGYVRRETNGNFTYVYQYKDHLGNVRLSYADTNNDGVIADAGFSDGFETETTWTEGYGGYVIRDNTVKRSGEYSAKLISTGVASYRQSDYMQNINNAVDTEYTFSAWVYGSGQAQITTFMFYDEVNYIFTSAVPTDSGPG